MKYLILIWLMAVSFAEAQPYYVSTTGSDANPGTFSQPFLTWSKAHTKMMANGTNIGVNNTTYVRGGNYYNVQLLMNGYQYGPTADSSGEQWIGYPGDPPAIAYAGQPLSGWTQNTDNTNLWHAALGTFPSTLVGNGINTNANWCVRNLMVNGTMMRRSQLPDYAYGTNYLYTNGNSDANLYLLGCTGGQVPSTLNAANDEISVDGSWDTFTMPASNITYTGAGNSVCLIGMSNALPTSTGDGGWNPIPGIKSFRIYNDTNGVTHPGQFYWDTASQTVYLWPPNGENPNTDIIIVPTATRIIYAYGYFGSSSPGKYGNSPHDVTLTNLTFAMGAACVVPEGDSGYLWDSQSQISFSVACCAVNWNISGCRFIGGAGNAVGADYAFNTNCTLSSNEIGWFGNYGAALHWGSNNVPLTNCFIHDCGIITRQAPGVSVHMTNTTTTWIVQNTFSNCATTGLHDENGDNEIVAFNLFYGCMNNNEDNGAYYQAGEFITGPIRGNTITSNLFLYCGTVPNTNANPTLADQRSTFRPAIYCDAWSSNATIAYNETIGCPMPFLFNIATNNKVWTNVLINTAIVPNYDSIRIYGSDLAEDGVTTGGSYIGNIVLTSSNAFWDNPSPSWSGYAPNWVYSLLPSDLGSQPSFVTTLGANPFASSSPPLALNAGTGITVPLVNLVPAVGYNGVSGPASFHLVISGPAQLSGAMIIQ